MSANDATATIMAVLRSRFHRVYDRYAAGKNGAKNIDADVAIIQGIASKSTSTKIQFRSPRSWPYSNSTAGAAAAISAACTNDPPSSAKAGGKSATIATSR